MKIDKTAILGAGSWGTALAWLWGKDGREIFLWGNNPERVARMQKTRENNDYIPGLKLPGSIRVTPIYDRSVSIVNSVVDVETTLVIAFVLVVMVIFAFLGRATDTLIPTVALPLSLLITFVAMRMLGYSLDNLSLMALTLAIGFLVDDAIVFLENTVRRMERGEQPFEAAINSAKEISFTIMSMTISLAAVFIPLVFMSGLVGRIFREFAITIVIATAFAIAGNDEIACAAQSIKGARASAHRLPQPDQFRERSCH